MCVCVRGAWRATVHGVAKSRTWFSNWVHTHTWICSFPFLAQEYILYWQLTVFRLSWPSFQALGWESGQFPSEQPITSVPWALPLLGSHTLNHRGLALIFMGSGIRTREIPSPIPWGSTKDFKWASSQGAKTNSAQQFAIQRLPPTAPACWYPVPGWNCFCGSAWQPSLAWSCNRGFWLSSIQGSRCFDVSCYEKNPYIL